MSDQRVTIEIEQQIALVKLSRPEKHNALDMPMFYQITEAIAQLKSDQSIRAVVVSGTGESFSSGLDVKSVMTNRSNAIKLLWKWWPTQANLAQKVTIGWRQLKVPVIMALHGKCWGGGMQIALGGDFRIAAPDCSLSIMEAKWGLIPDMGGTPALMENVALDQAMKMAMTAEVLSAKQALESKLITEISEKPLQRAKQLAEQLKQRSPDTNQKIKSMYQRVWNGKQGRVLAAETYNQWKIILGKNQRIAVKRAMGDNDIEYR
ncbi:MAG: crotonase/enoyl-CoA hydratase family protein [Kangiellaceae bacterium]